MPELPDERLAAELQRRATLTPAGQDWSDHSLARGVMDEIRTQPAPVPTSRVSRWVSLAAVAATLALLVVALPRLTPPPNPGVPSASLRPSPPSLQTGGLSVLTTADFAAQLAAGRLDGQTVLVDGTIVPYAGPTLGGAACGQAGPACVIGQLDGVDPLVVVFSQDVPVAPADESTTAPGDAWSWWQRFMPPIQGDLVLSVLGSNEAEYLGRVVPGGTSLAWSVGDVKNVLNVLARDLDEVVLVDGWLTGYYSPGPFSCPMMPAVSSAFLLRRDGCGVGSWLADGPDLVDPRNVVVPDSAVRVQSDAFTSFAPDPSVRSGDSVTPQRAVYALAKRLYSGDCIMDPSGPCWDWATVGRLSQPAPDVAPSVRPAPPTPRVANTPSRLASAPPGARRIECGDYVLFDYTGVVAECQSKPEAVRAGWAVIVNPSGDLTQLDMTWTGATCTPLVELQLSSSGTGYLLVAQERAPVVYEAVPSCAGGFIGRGADLVLRKPISVDTVQFSVTQGTANPVATP